jgi:hypothetical protein
MSPTASLFVLALWMAGPAAVDAKADRQAREHVRKGAEAFRDGRYDAAMAEFEAGYAAVPRPGFLLNMGHVQRQAGNLARARDYYRRYLDLEPGSAQRATVEKALREIDASLRGGAAAPGTPPPRRPVALASTVDDSEVPVDLKLAASEPTTRRAELVPQRDDSTPVYRRWWFWATAGGVAVAGVLGFLLLRPDNDGYATSGTWGALGR